MSKRLRALSAARLSVSGLSSPRLEGLESRLLLSKPAPIAKFSQPAFYFNDVSATDSGGSGQSVQQMLIIRNAGTLPLTFNSKGLRIQGDNASEFIFTGKRAPATIEPGATRSIPIAFKASAEGIRTAILLAKSNDLRHNSISIPLRGLGTAGVGGDNEPSLQHVLDLFQIPDNVGDSNPNDTNFAVPASTPNDEVNLQQMVKAGDGPVQIDWLADFVNVNSPAMSMGYYHPGQPELGSTQLFTVPKSADSQSVHPTISGTNKFDPGTSSFGIYTAYPAFGNRKSLSEDALNQWEPKSQNRKKIRFYPMKNPDGSVVANAYVFAAEDYNVVYDFQDGVGIIRNVKIADSAPTIGIQNQDVLPANDRVALDRISNLDMVRPNKFHDTAVLTLINSGGSTLTVSSLQLSDGNNFKIVSGGGSNIKIAPNSTHNLTLQFVAAPSSGLTATYATTLTVNSNDPDEPARVINVTGLWQDSSEKTADNHYSEPSLKTIVNSAFAYTTTITKPGETTNHGGHPVLVGDEINSPYWDQADLSQSIYIRQLADFHRQNNFDPMTGLPITAASTLAWYPRGNSTQINKLLTHNIDEGQTLLPHLSGSTTKPALGSFKQEDSTPFGFVVDKNHFTDDSLNALDFNPNDPNRTGIPGTGHAFRIYPLKDANGNVVANSYIFAMDYTSNEFANWDYQDNVYLISNIKPAPQSGAQASPQSLAGRPAATTLFSQAPVAADRPDVLGSIGNDLL